MKELLTKFAEEVKTHSIDPPKFVDGGSEESTDLRGGVINVINWVMGIIGLVCVVVIIIGGVQYMTSTGDPGKVKKAKDTILYGIIGLIVVLLAAAIVNFVIGQFISTNSTS